LHQQKSDSATDAKWYDRGSKGTVATKYRKGACENCGAMGHKAKDCLQRPRKHGAKWTGKDIQGDQSMGEVKLGWDAKRDRWNGYDPSEYSAIVNEYQELEEMKKAGRLHNVDGSKAGDANEDDVEEGTKYEEETDMGRQQSTATRNLRLREDTAKYLLNLDLDSAKYDPKTRSMVDSGATADEAAALVAEEGFMKASGDAAEFERAQRYAWESQERGGKDKIHLQANPTSGEILRKKEQAEAAARREAQQKVLLEKYGSQEHLKKNNLKDLAILESERYIEYDEDGSIKGAPKIKPRSKYAEDIYVNNHTSVWGSWWQNFQWGYACCHSTVKNSYCTGEQGKIASAESSMLKNGDLPDVATNMANSSRDNTEALKPNKIGMVPSNKRTISDREGGVTEADMEEYRRKRHQSNDPMAQYLGKETTL
jgi:pre-mRNA-processing factor SLU7